MAMRRPKQRPEGPAASRPPSANETDPARLPPCVERVFVDGAAAWGPFIETYSPFLMGCARRFAADYDERMEIYIYVSGRLRAQDCKRLRQFRGTGEHGPCKFTTWLGTVAHNLAKEWIRTQRGRRRIYKRVAEMSDLDQDVFRYRFWEGYAVSEIASAMQASHGHGLSEAAVVRSLRRIHEQLGIDQRWRLLTGPARRQRVPATWSAGDCRNPEPAAKGHGSGESIASAVAARTLREALSALPQVERRSLELRYREGRSARQIARLLGTKSYKRVYEIQARALLKLRARLRTQGIEFSDFAALLNEKDGAL